MSSAAIWQTPEAVARALGKAERSGKSWRAQCPAHDDKTPSLSIKAGEDGRLLVHCHGHCDQQAVIDALRKRGLWGEFPDTPRKPNNNGSKGAGMAHRPAGDDDWHPIVPPPPNTPKPTDTQLRCDMLHEYYDADDHILCYVRRHEKKGDQRKQFIPLTFGVLNGVKGWHTKAPLAPRPLYRLNALSHAAPDAPVLLVEGEKAAEAAQRLFPDYVAMAWMGGRKADDHADLGPLLGHPVTVWPDADADGGGQQAGARLAARIPRSRTLNVDGLPDGFDAADLELQGVDDPMAWLEARLPKPEDVIQDEATALGIWDAGDDDYQIEPREWLLSNVFCKKFLSSLIGDGAVGKTALRIAQVAAVVTKRHITGQHVFRRGRALIISLEDDRNELRRRVYAMLLGHGIKPEDVRGYLFLAAPKRLKLAKMVNGSPEAAELESLLRDAITTLKLDLVCIDPFIKTHSVGENDNTAMDFVCDLLAAMAIDLNCAIDFPHHTNKGPASPGDANRGRGASSTKDAGRLVHTLTPMSSLEGEMFGLSESDRRSLVRMDNAKVNIAPPSAEAKWFQIVGVLLGNGNDTYPKGDDVQTVKPWTPADFWDGLDHPMLNRILDDIDRGMDNGRRYSAANAAGSRAVWPVVQKHCPDKSEKQCRAVIATWVKSGTLFTEDYEDPADRKTRSGLRVNPIKRPS